MKRPSKRTAWIIAGVLAVAGAGSTVALETGAGAAGSPSVACSRTDDGTNQTITCPDAPTPTVTVTVTVSSSSIPTPTPTTTVTTPSPTPTSSAPTGAFPDATTTGVPAGTTLKASGSIDVTKAGTV